MVDYFFVSTYSNFKILFLKIYVSWTRPFPPVLSTFVCTRPREKLSFVWHLTTFYCALRCVWWRVCTQIYCRLIHLIEICVIQRCMIPCWPDLHVCKFQLLMMLACCFILFIWNDTRFLSCSLLGSPLIYVVNHALLRKNLIMYFVILRLLLFISTIITI